MRLTEYVHLCLEKHLKNGDCVLDATAGNGYDTLKAAQLIQPNGQVTSIDIQEDAIEATEARLTQAKLNTLCEFHLGSHGELLERLNQTFDAILFNLGYLPGSDKMVITTPRETLSALNQSPKLLKENGILFVTAYRQHTGGQDEADQVAEWMLEKQTQGWSIEKIEPNHTSNYPSPLLWIASKSTLSIPRFTNRGI
jgi:ubiquinone/menaquinone biosynthesis C-methylase UbiE